MPRDREPGAPASGRRPPPEAPSYDLLAVLGRVGGDLRRIFLPRALARLRAGVGRLAGGASSAAARLTAHREPIAAVSARIAWWGALALLVVAGRELLGGPEQLSGAVEPLVGFAVGLGACVLVVTVARPLHLRLAGVALGTGHAALALLAYLSALDPTALS